MKVTKPEATADQGNMLAAHLRRVRKERGLRQTDAALIMGVTEDSILNWEASQEPQARMYPTIIAFLGYEPWPEPVSLSERLKAARLRRGWSVKRTAARLNIDEGTFAGWERQTRRPTRLSRALIEAFCSDD